MGIDLESFSTNKTSSLSEFAFTYSTAHDVNQSIIKCSADGNKIEDLVVPEEKVFLFPWLKRGTIAFVNAQKSVGKTWFGLIITLALTRGISIGRWYVENTTNVLYIDGEMAASEMKRRITSLKMKLVKPSGLFKLFSADILSKMGASTPNLIHEFWRDGIYDFLKEHPAYEVLILDNISSLFPCIDENDTAAWGFINQWLLRLRRLDVGTVLMHHLGKNIEAGGRGTSARIDNVDVVLELTAPPKDKQRHDGYFNVKFKYVRGFSGEDAKPIGIQMRGKVPDSVEWLVDKRPTSEYEDIVIALLGREYQQVDIAKMVKCDQSTVSRIKKRAITNKYLNDDNTFTASGRTIYEGYDIEKSICT